MNLDERLAAIAAAFQRAGLRFLVMGGHAARYYGVSRDTFDFDFHLALTMKEDLTTRLERTGLFGNQPPVEIAVWRTGDFQRFLLGRLPDGREEWLEFWFRNHLLAPFEELYARREEGMVAGKRLPFLGLPDLIRSKETERESDWQDVALLEEILDSRNLANAHAPEGEARALANLRSRRGYRMAEVQGLLKDTLLAANALNAAGNPITKAFLLPIIPSAPETSEGGIPALIAKPLRSVAPGSSRHMALVEATRRVYRQNAILRDRVDKERIRGKP